MIRRPPRSTRTDTLVPYTTLFRSIRADFFDASRQVGPERVRKLQGEELLHIAALEFDIEGIEAGSLDPNQNFACAGAWLGNFFERWSSVVVADTNSLHHTVPRSEERRVGNECVSTCRSRSSPKT